MPAEITALQTYFVGWSVEQAAASVWQPVWLVHAVHVSGVAAESWLWPVAQAVTALSDALVLLSVYAVDSPLVLQSHPFHLMTYYRL